MGIESDQLVFDYLSRVGDLAQQRQLSSADRMRLVTELRGRIDRDRAKAGSDSPASVRRILGRIGTPDAVISSAAEGSTDGSGSVTLPEPPPPATDLPAKLLRSALPGQRRKQAAKPARARPARPESGSPGPSSPEPPDGPGTKDRGAGRPRWKVPGARRSGPEAPEAPEELPREQTQPGPAAAPPHLASQDQVGSGVSGPDTADVAPDWWRVDNGPFGTADQVHGFVGGVEIPDLLKPPRGRHDRPADGDDGDRDIDDDGRDTEGADGADGPATPPDAPAAAAAPARRGLRRLRGPVGGTGIRLGSPMLLLAAALLIVGAVLGNLIALGAGWLLAYVTRRLSPAESKWAVLVLPGLSLVGGLVWLWGRTERRWGAPIPDAGMADAIGGVWPVVLRVAAVSSALYLVWRARRVPVN